MNHIQVDKNEFVVNTIITPSEDAEKDVMILIRSWKQNGGSLSTAPIGVYQLAIGKDISKKAYQQLEKYDVEIIQFKVSEEEIRFPFMMAAIACAEAEKLGLKDEAQIAWLAKNTVVLREPHAFLLNEGE